MIICNGGTWIRTKKSGFGDPQFAVELIPPKMEKQIADGQSQIAGMKIANSPLKQSATSYQR